MGLPSIRRLALADLHKSGLRGLIEHGEDLLVERKREPPPSPRFGAEVASFANTLGGWLLVGVDDDHNVVGWTPPSGADVQSHIGNLLRNQVDPIPPFLADTRELDGKTVTVIRVFESIDGPVLVRGTGAIYVRDSGGKQPVRDQRLLLEMARRGEAARRVAEERLRELRIITIALRGPYRDRDMREGPDLVGVTVKLAPMTITPTFEDWALSHGAVAWAEEQTKALTPKEVAYDQHGPLTRPFGRGFGSSRLREHPEPWCTASVAVDAGGVIGAELLSGWRPDGFVIPDQTRDEQIVPLLDVCVEGLRRAENFGVAVADVWITVPIDVRVLVRNGGFAQLINPGWFYASASLAVPADSEEIRALAAAWTREFMREAQRAEWEPSG